MVGGGWRLAVGGDWWLAVGNWRLVAVGGGWRLVIGGWWRLVVVGGWRLVAAGGWWELGLVVGGPLGRSLRAVLNKKKSGSLRTALDKGVVLATEGRGQVVARRTASLSPQRQALPGHPQGVCCSQTDARMCP